MEYSPVYVKEETEEEKHVFRMSGPKKDPLKSGWHL